MSAPRPTPFSLIFAALAPQRFPGLRDALSAAGVDPEHRDAFLLLRETAELLHQLRPEEGMGDAVQALGALLHHAFLFWLEGERLRVVEETELAALLQASPGRREPSDGPAAYLQLPPLRVWGTPVEAGPPEPLDGWFVLRRGEWLALLAIFGLNPGRAGLTTVELSGPRPGRLQRLDGSAPFAPVLAGGREAGLASIVGEAELLELAWRAEAGP